ncbi:cyclic nucleotide-binding domain-containing protein [Pseudonocardiaceae bacterium YIM PH 21723]|nr:cyclic nucleotide-binding domain-containing protein [Pseudonocardiaceae bacterium YIM PH 21723]
MTVTDPDLGVESEQPQLSLSTQAARNLATTTKSEPQMQGITSRWLLKLLPWVEAKGGAYRVNRRLSYAIGDNRLTFTNTGAAIRVIPQELQELPALRGFDTEEVLSALADRCIQREYGVGDVIVEFGHQAEKVYLIAHGKIHKVGLGEYGDATVRGTLADGDYFGDPVLVDEQVIWEHTFKAATPATVLELARQDFERIVDQDDSLRAHVEAFRASPRLAQNESGEAMINVASGHAGEAQLPGTFADYDPSPREYELSVAQTVLQVHSRVADLYNNPMNQVEQQLRLTIEALRERQEYEMVNNTDFGLLHNADLKQRIPTHSGPPTPDDLDDLLDTVWKDPAFILAHPKAIVAFARQCNKVGIYPDTVDFNGHHVPAWRGVPLLPCNKLPISETKTTSMLVMRTGEEAQGVIGLRQTGIPDEYEPGLNVRFMGVNDQAVIKYLVSTYYSAAVLVPDALGILENVELGRHD